MKDEHAPTAWSFHPSSFLLHPSYFILATRAAGWAYAASGRREEAEEMRKRIASRVEGAAHVRELPGKTGGLGFVKAPTCRDQPVDCVAIQ